LREKPDDGAKIVARLGPSVMVGNVSYVRARGEWILVRWSKEQSSQAEFDRGKGNGKGWLKQGQIKGECED
jgi:SH3-like domain-containing protein